MAQNKNKNKIIDFYRSPRVLAVIFALFIATFATKVFASGYKFPEILLALGLYLIPAAVVGVAIIIAWKRERVGGMIFLLLGFLYIILAWQTKPIISYALISGPSFLIGAMFLSNSQKLLKRNTGK